MSVLLKENKKSEAIDNTAVALGTITLIREGMSNKNNKVYFVTMLDEDGDLHQVTTGQTEEIKLGNGAINQIQWNAKSKFGAKVSTKIRNF